MNSAAGARARFSRAWLAMFLSAGCGVAVQFALSFIVGKLAPAIAAAPWFIYALLAAQYLVCMPVMSLALRETGVSARPRRGVFDIKRVAALLPVSMLAGYMMNALGGALSSLIARLAGREYGNPVEQALGGVPLPLLFAMTVIIAPICEEYMFRHLLLGALRPYGDGAAIAVSALAFGLFHFNFTQFFYALAIGLLLGYAAVKSGGIAESVALHMLVNLLGSVVVPALLERSPALAYAAVSALCAAGVVVAVAAISNRWMSLGKSPLERPLTARDVFGNVGFIAFFALSAVMFTAAVFV